MKPAIVLADGDRYISEELISEVHAWYGAAYDVREFASDRETLDFVQHLSGTDCPAALVIVGQDLLGREWAFCQEIERVSPFTVRAVVVRDRPAPEVVDAMNQHGVDRILRQPYSAARMRSALDSLLSRHRQLLRLRAEARGRLGRHVFMTGAAGFLGCRLAHELLRCSEVKITAVLRGTNRQSYRDRLHFSPDDYPGRLEILEGDITLPNLGLKDAELHALEESVDEVWHLAAITSFEESLRETIMQVNVESTARVLDFASKMKHLKCFNHVSTAYVAGNRSYPEVVYEELQEEAPGFKNPYEESKFLAEHLVAKSGLPYLIYRPSVVFGESYSGRSDGKTIYGVAQVFRMAKRMYERRLLSNGHDGPLGSLRVQANDAANKNLIPVDVVVDLLVRLRAAKAPDASIFHLTHPMPITMGQLYDVVAELNGIEKGTMQPSFDSGDLISAEEFLMRKLQTFIPYMILSDPVFDTTNTRSVLKDFDVPTFDRDFLRFAIGAFYQYALGDLELENWETERPVVQGA